jgi:glycosyltransferase involved in cell wall biosynthesis/SAM-dependent methyltransferase
MRIFYACHQFFPEYYTGTERYTLELARQAQRMGHHVSVLTYATKGFGTGISVKKGVTRTTYEYENVPVIALRHSEFEKNGELAGVSFELTNPAIFQEVTKILNERPIDILHCIHPMRVGEAIRAAKEASVKVVLHLMDYWMLCPRTILMRVDGALCEGPDRGNSCAAICYKDNAMSERVLKRYRDSVEILAMADAVVSHSQFLINVFRGSGIDTHRFHHCPSGFDYAKVKTKKGEPHKRNTVNFGFIGTILPHKGVDVLIDAFNRVTSDNIRLKIYGGYFEHREYYSRLIKKSAGNEKIEFCGDYEYNDIAMVLEAIDVVVVPSLWYENAPLVISTAQAFGIPVIATRLGGMAEMVADHVNGFSFRPGDAEDLAEKIRLIAAKPDVLDHLSRKKVRPPRIESEVFLLESLYFALIQGDVSVNRTDGGAAIDVNIPLPPIEFMKLVGDAPDLPNVFQKVGRGVIEMMRAAHMLQEGTRVLDVGCGCGRMARHLIAEPIGSYTGFDRHPGMIEWCKQNFASQAARFSFHHFDVKSPYDLADGHRGSIDLSSFRFPFTDESFDSILLASVFTHLTIEDADHYLTEMARVLSGGGKIMLSVFFSEGEPHDNGINFFYSPDDFFRRVKEKGFSAKQIENKWSNSEHNWILLIKQEGWVPSQLAVKQHKIDVVHVNNPTDLFRYFDKSQIRRVIDIGCHRGWHIENILSVEFSHAEIIGVEPKLDNYLECVKLKTDKINFLQLDCRDLRQETLGVFDVVWCWGLIYHLDDPTLLMKSLQSITHSTSVICIEGHIAVEGEQACLSHPNPPIIERTFDSYTYYGKVYKEFEEGESQADKDKKYKASLDNPWAFWLTYDSMIELFIRYGFSHVVEFRCDSPTAPLGPGFFCPAIDPNRAWSRRLFLVSCTSFL